MPIHNILQDVDVPLQPRPCDSDEVSIAVTSYCPVDNLQNLGVLKIRWRG